MPLTVNVGICGKASANYQSAGLSINLIAELDQSLMADPPRLQSEDLHFNEVTGSHPSMLESA